MKRARSRSPVAKAPEPPPAALGFRMPAEWEPHAATWIAWPHEPRDWPGKLPAIDWVYGEVVRHLAVGERVRILVSTAAVAKRARDVLRRVGVDRKRVQLFAAPTDRSWTRDYCPIYVVNDDGEVAITNWRFNGWAKYANHKRDDAVNDRIARKDRVRQWQPTARVGKRIARVVLEGGAIDVNGTGTLLATEECLLDEKVQARNPGLGREALESVLAAHLGVRKVLWLGRGISGDDTHGHIDDLARFVDETHGRRRAGERPRRRRLRTAAREPRPPRTHDHRRRAAAARAVAADAGAAVPRRHPAARELRELLHRQRGGHRADVQRSERSRGAGDAGRAVPRPGAWSAFTRSIWSGASGRSTA